MRVNWPIFPGGKCLPEERKIGEGSHHENIMMLKKVGTEAIEIELRFEVMHPTLKDGFPVQGTPETNSVVSLHWYEWFFREVEFFLSWPEIDVGKYHQVGIGLFENLRPPSCFVSCVVAFSLFESECAEDFH